MDTQGRSAVIIITVYFLCIKMLEDMGKTNRGRDRGHRITGFSLFYC